MFLRTDQGTNTRSIDVLDVNPLEGSAELDSWMGTDRGICPWVITLVMRKYDGVVVLGGLWMVFLWDPCRWGDRDGEETLVK